MAYDWYDDIDQIAWNFEDAVNRAASSHAGSLGMAPSAGDEVRAILRQVASVPPRQLIDEADSVSRDDVTAAVGALASAAVDAAIARGSRHVTREDVRNGLSSAGAYPFKR